MTLTSFLYFWSAFYIYIVFFIPILSYTTEVLMVSLHISCGWQHSKDCLGVISPSLPVAWIVLKVNFFFSFFFSQCASLVFLLCTLLPSGMLIYIYIYIFCAVICRKLSNPPPSFFLSFRGKNWQHCRRRKMLTCNVENETKCWMLNNVILYLKKKKQVAQINTFLMPAWLLI